MQNFPYKLLERKKIQNDRSFFALKAVILNSNFLFKKVGHHIPSRRFGIWMNWKIYEVKA